MNSLSGWLGRKTLSALKSLRLSSPLGATSLVDCPRWPLASCVRLFPTIAGHVYSQTSSRPTLTEYFVALGIFGILIGLSPCGGPNSNSLGKAPTRASLGSAQSNWFGVLALHRKACGGEISKDFDSGYRAPERCRAALVENNFRRRCVTCFFSAFSLRKVRRSDDLSTVETTRPPQSGAAFRCQYVCKEAVREGPGHPLAIPEARHRKATK